MANSYVFYPSATGGQTDYAIPFAYLSSTFVKATVNGASVPFTFLSTSMIRFTTAPVGALKIYRQTTKAPVNTFINGSILVDDDLNGSFLQSLHIAEEVSESSMQTATDGAWDATNLRIKNVANPVNPQDVVTKAWADATGNGYIGAAGAQAAAAAASAAAALADKNTVATDKGIVAGYKTTVSTDKDTVAADKAIVLGYKNAADADKVATAADRVQTGLDRVATAADRVQTGQDKTATAADRVQTGLDRTAASGSASAAATSAAAAAASAGSLTPVETQIHAATANSSIADAHEFGMVSSSSTPLWGLRKITWADLKTAIKTYIQSAALAITGTLSATGNISSGPAGTQGSVILQSGSSIELGAGRTADGLAFIDFSAVASADYNARFLRNTGTNGTFQIINSGAGDIQLQGSGSLTWNGSQIATNSSINYSAGNAALLAGDIGTYGLFRRNPAAATNPGDLLAGSSLLWANAGTVGPAGSPAGTWRCMGRTGTGADDNNVTVWLRVS